MNHPAMLTVTATTVVADLAVKAAAVQLLPQPVELGPMTLRVTANSGIAFGIGAGRSFALVGSLTALAVAAMAVLAWRGHLGTPIPAGLVLGGGVANLADRLATGTVVDIFDLGWFPVFNLADIAITTGIALIVLTGLRADQPDTARADR